MRDKAAFFLFLAAVIAAGLGFGYYAKDIKCAEITAIPALECLRLYLAFGVLFAVAVLLAVGAGFYALIPPPASGEHPGKQIFDTLAKSLLPVVTLVLGYYFGSTQSGSGQQAAAPAGKAASGAASVAAPAASAVKPK